MSASTDYQLEKIRELLEVVRAEGTGIATLALLEQATTAFGDLRTAELTPVAGWSFHYGILDRHIVTTVAGGAAVGASEGRGFMTVSEASQTATVAARKALRYVSGVGALHRMTAVWNGDWAGVGDLRGYAGLGDANDGFFLGYQNGIFGFLRRQAGSDIFTPWGEWSLDAQLETGEGPTGIQFNPARSHPFQIQYQWLGSGAITVSVENPVTGKLVPVHRVAYAGTSQANSIRNPNIPPCMEVTTGAGFLGSPVSMLSASAMSFTEGQAGMAGTVLAAAWNEASLAAGVAGTAVPVLSLANLATFNGIANRIRAELVNMDWAATAGSGSPRSLEFVIYKGTRAEIEAALTDESFAAVEAGESCFEVDTAATAVDPSGLLVEWRERVVVPNDHHDEPERERIIIEPGEAIIVTGELISGSGTVDAEASMRWIEPT